MLVIFNLSSVAWVQKSKFQRVLVKTDSAPWQCTCTFIVYSSSKVTCACTPKKCVVFFLPCKLLAGRPCQLLRTWQCEIKQALYPSWIRWGSVCICLQASLGGYTCRQCYHLLGVDVILDSQLNPYVIEVSVSLSLSLSLSALNLVPLSMGPCHTM